MKTSARPILVAGIAVISASAIAIAQSVQPPPPRAPAIQLTAAVQTTAPTSPTALAFNPVTDAIDLIERVVIPPSLGKAPPPPPTLIFPAPGSIGSTIKNVYNAVEPWVAYGFDLAAYAVGWIPYVGWLAPQITIFYNLVERIVRSITFNIADWLDGSITFGQGLINVGVDTINSFIFFANDQLAFWLPPLPPIPPLPPFPFAAKPATRLGALAPALQKVSAPVTLKDAVQQIEKGIAGHTTSAAPAATQPATGAKPLPKAVTVTKGGVSAQGDVRGAVVTPATDVPNDAAGGGPGAVVNGVSGGVKAASSSVKKASDTVSSPIRKAGATPGKK